MTTFREFFLAATGHRPYPYQCRVAEEDASPRLLSILTGAGRINSIALACCGIGVPLSLSRRA